MIILYIYLSIAAGLFIYHSRSTFKTMVNRNDRKSLLYWVIPGIMVTLAWPYTWAYLTIRDKLEMRKFRSFIYDIKRSDEEP